MLLSPMLMWWKAMAHLGAYWMSPWALCGNAQSASLPMAFGGPSWPGGVCPTSPCQLEWAAFGGPRWAPSLFSSPTTEACMAQGPAVDHNSVAPSCPPLLSMRVAIRPNGPP